MLKILLKQLTLLFYKFFVFLNNFLLPFLFTSLCLLLSFYYGKYGDGFTLLPLAHTSKCKCAPISGCDFEGLLPLIEQKVAELGGCQGADDAEQHSER